MYIIHSGKGYTQYRLLSLMARILRRRTISLLTVIWSLTTIPFINSIHDRCASPDSGNGSYSRMCRCARSLFLYGREPGGDCMASLSGAIPGQPADVALGDSVMVLVRLTNTTHDQTRSYYVDEQGSVLGRVDLSLHHFNHDSGNRRSDRMRADKVNNLHSRSRQLHRFTLTGCS